MFGAEAYNEVGGNIIAVDLVPDDRVSNYGVIKPHARVDAKNASLIAMDGMVEKPALKDAPSNLKITGRYILQPELMGLLKDQAAGAGGEIQLTDAMARLMKQQDFHAFIYQGQDYDCGSKLGYFEAVMAFARAHAKIGKDSEDMIRKFAAG